MSKIKLDEASLVDYANRIGIENVEIKQITPKESIPKKVTSFIATVKRMLGISPKNAEVVTVAILDEIQRNLEKGNSLAFVEKGKDGKSSKIIIYNISAPSQKSNK